MRLSSNEEEKRKKKEKEDRPVYIQHSSFRLGVKGEPNSIGKGGGQPIPEDTTFVV